MREEDRAVLRDALAAYNVPGIYIVAFMCRHTSVKLAGHPYRKEMLMASLDEHFAWKQQVTLSELTDEERLEEIAGVLDDLVGTLGR